MTRSLSHRRVFGSLLCAALPAAALLAPTQASAQVVKCNPASPSPENLTCSLATSLQPTPTKEETERLQTSIDTGWAPSCPGGGHCSDEKVQFRAQMAFDPTKAGGDTNQPIYVVDMSKRASVQVRWPTPDAFVVELVPPTNNDGTFSVTHTLTPEIGLYLDLGAIGLGQTEINLDTTDLINLIPGAQFNYTASGSESFSPWGFDGVTTKVEGTDLNNSQLFSITFQELGNLIGTSNFSGIIEGDIGLNATTDTDFTYTTTEIQVIGATGGPITDQDGSTQLPITGEPGDFLQFRIAPSGTIDYSGQLEFFPRIGITSVAGIPISLNFAINAAKIDVPYSSDPIPVDFPGSTVKIPLPNVFVPGSFLDFGKIEIGDRSDKTVLIDNTGELGASLSFESNNDQFLLEQTATTMGPGPSEYELKVTFRPTTKGTQMGTITVRSNDPNEPEQTFDVYGFGDGDEIPNYAGGSGGQPPSYGGTGAGGTGGVGGVGASGGDSFALPPPAGAGAGDDGGCGCSVPGDDTRNAGGLAFLLLVGVAGSWRRRRKKI